MLGWHVEPRAIADVAGKLPATAGWQPALPGIAFARVDNFTAHIPRMQRVRRANTKALLRRSATSR